MAVLRFELSLSIPEDSSGTLILSSKDELGQDVGGIRIPSTLASKIPAIKDGIRFLMSFSSKINEGLPNEEQTTRAILRICYHDEGEGHREDGPEVEL